MSIRKTLFTRQRLYWALPVGTAHKPPKANRGAYECGDCTAVVLTWFLVDTCDEGFCVHIHHTICIWFWPWTTWLQYTKYCFPLQNREQLRCLEARNLDEFG